MEMCLFIRRAIAFLAFYTRQKSCLVTSYMYQEKVKSHTVHLQRAVSLTKSSALTDYKDALDTMLTYCGFYKRLCVKLLNHRRPIKYLIHKKYKLKVGSCHQKVKSAHLFSTFYENNFVREHFMLLKGKIT